MMRFTRWICRTGTCTADGEIVALAGREGRVVVSKDADFVTAYILRHEPERLLLISTGNISNAQLEKLLLPLVPSIAGSFETSAFIEVTRFGVMVHG